LEVCAFILKVTYAGLEAVILKLNQTPLLLELQKSKNLPVSGNNYKKPLLFIREMKET